MSAKHLLAAAAALVAAAAFAAPGGAFDDSPAVAERIKTAHGYMKSANYSGAIREMQQALREEPRNPEIHNILGFSYRKQARPDLARSFEHYNTALKLDPKNKATHEYIGEAYLMDRKPDMAEKHLAQLESICGKDCAEYKELAEAIGVYKASAK